MRPLLSVIIPTYKRPRLLEMAVRSVTEQVGLPSEQIEIIIVDDASPVPIRVPDAPNAQVIRHQENSGQAAARNTGIDAAAGDLVAFLDSDDYWLPNHLSSLITHFDEQSKTCDPALLAVGSGFYDPNRRLGGLRSRLPRRADDPLHFASGCWFCPGSALVVSKEAFRHVGYQDSEMRRLEDLDWFIRFSLAGGKYECSGQHDVLIRPSGEAPIDAVLLAATQMTAKFGPSGSTPLPPPIWRRLNAYLSLEKSIAFLGTGQRASAIRHLGTTWFLKPRTQAALENFWDQGKDIPDLVTSLYQEMCAPDENGDETFL